MDDFNTCGTRRSMLLGSVSMYYNIEDYIMKYLLLREMAYNLLIMYRDLFSKDP